MFRHYRRRQHLLGRVPLNYDTTIETSLCPDLEQKPEDTTNLESRRPCPSHILSFLLTKIKPFYTGPVAHSTALPGAMGVKQALDKAFAKFDKHVCGFDDDMEPK
jgi:hypothetical protein